MEITTELLSGIVSSALKRGATEAEAIALESTEFSVEVRLGEVETLQESASRGIGLRVIYEGRQASASTSDTQAESLEKLVAEAVEMARHTSPDEASVLPSREEFSGSSKPDLELYDEEVASLSTERKIEMAKACEAAALSADPRMTNSEGGSCSTTLGRMLLVTSSGFAGEYHGSNCGLLAAPIATENNQMQQSFWGESQRSLKKLTSPEAIGREAAHRALRKLGARKVPTQEVPIIFDAPMTGELLRNFFEAVSGESVFRRSSFLVGKLNESIAASDITIIDDGTIPGAVGSRPFDGEGLPSRRTVVVENGVLRSYLLNTYTARKLGLHSTANGMRGLTGAPGVGVNNFYLEAGKTSPEEMIASVKRGFFVTELIGFGFNPVTGDYSRGASGIWIENGKFTHPVEEVTIAGNFRDMLRGVEMIGNDLYFRSNISAPTIKINKMMVSGD
jgi:PmbA protein